MAGATDGFLMHLTPLDFYVYALIDPRCGSIFYVGKGKGRRAWQHEADARRGRQGNPSKYARIRSIIDEGLRPVVQIVAEYDLEDDAFEHEIEMISATAGLTNLRAGGEGCCLDAETIAKRAEARRLRVLVRREAGRKAHIHGAKNRAADRREKEFLAVAGDRHAVEVSAWLASVKTKADVGHRKGGRFTVRSL